MNLPEAIKDAVYWLNVAGRTIVADELVNWYGAQRNKGGVNREECSPSKRGRQQSATSALLGDGVRSTPAVEPEERFDSYHPSQVERHHD